MQTEEIKSQPLVSVIMPTYNRADLLAKSVESVLSQTYRDLELLVVDDRSTDNTATVLKNLSNEDPRLRYILNDGVKGVAGARNTGLAMVQGEFIAFLDDDDEFLSEKVAHHLKPFRDPEVGAVISVGPGLTTLAKPSDSQWLVIEFAPQKLFHPCNVMCRRNILQNIRFRFDYMEWRDLAFQFYQKGIKVTLVEQQMVKINDTGNSLSKNATAMLNRALINAQEYFSFAKERAEEGTFRHYLANCHKNCANYALKKGKIRKALQHYLCSFETEKKIRNLIPFS